MSNRYDYNLRRWTLILGIAVFVLGLSPLLTTLILPAASSLEASLLRLLVIPTSVIAGTASVAVGLYKGRENIFDGLRAICLFLDVLYLPFLLYLAGSLLWNTLIGPSAKIVIPNDFEGRFSIVIEDFTKPSRSTIGRRYTYQIPHTGELQVPNGWLALRFAFDEDYNNVPRGLYYVQIIRRDGALIRGDEFDCNYLDKPIVRGITCFVRDRHGLEEDP